MFLLLKDHHFFLQDGEIFSIFYWWNIFANQTCQYRNIFYWDTWGLASNKKLWLPTLSTSSAGQARQRFQNCEIIMMLLLLLEELLLTVVLVGTGGVFLSQCSVPRLYCSRYADSLESLHHWRQLNSPLLLLLPRLLHSASDLRIVSSSEEPSGLSSGMMKISWNPAGCWIVRCGAAPTYNKAGSGSMELLAAGLEWCGAADRGQAGSRAGLTPDSLAISLYCQAEREGGREGWQVLREREKLSEEIYFYFCSTEQSIPAQPNLLKQNRTN